MQQPECAVTEVGPLERRPIRAISSCRQYHEEHGTLDIVAVGSYAGECRCREGVSLHLWRWANMPYDGPGGRGSNAPFEGLGVAATSFRACRMNNNTRNVSNKD